MSHKKVIISGGGTGGHIFPAISIANALKEKDESLEILFVGALGRIEMEKVPAAGYNIVGLPVSGFQRKLTLKNFKVLWNLYKSLKLSGKIIKDFKPDVAVGVGGYASGPVVRTAAKNGVPALLQEQNSYAGVTNKLLSKHAKTICVAYENMERFFPKEKIILTGNPVRKDLTYSLIDRSEAIKHFGLDETKKTILILGGSGGARTINESIISKLDEIKNWKNVQLILQTGKYYYDKVNEQYKQNPVEHLKVMAFVSRMDLAYKAADVVISRAGAGTISELCLVEKPSILVPSPNVAEDHQTKNAMALVKNNAAILVKDIEAIDKLVGKTYQLIQNENKMTELKENIKKMAKPNAADEIAAEVIKLIEK